MFPKSHWTRYLSAQNELGGEDYELLFSIKQEDFDKIKGNPHLSVIGHFTAKDSGIYLVDKQGAAFPIKAQGWDHFQEGK